MHHAFYQRYPFILQGNNNTNWNTFLNDLLFITRYTFTLNTKAINY